LTPERRAAVIEARRENPTGTQEEIARVAGVSRATVSRSSAPVVAAIVKAHGEPVNVDYMMRRSGDSWLISDDSIAATREGPKVCRLPAGGRWIRTLGPPATVKL
jgi:transcriptional regulator with XRE-family HTH domain